MNLRPSAPKADALPGCATPRLDQKYSTLRRFAVLKIQPFAAGCRKSPSRQSDKCLPRGCLVNKLLGLGCRLVFAVCLQPFYPAPSLALARRLAAFCLFPRQVPIAEGGSTVAMRALSHPSMAGARHLRLWARSPPRLCAAESPLWGVSLWP